MFCLANLVFCPLCKLVALGTGDYVGMNAGGGPECTWVGTWFFTSAREACRKQDLFVLLFCLLAFGKNKSSRRNEERRRRREERAFTGHYDLPAYDSTPWCQVALFDFDKFSY